jgi:hypothetical protein
MNDPIESFLDSQRPILNLVDQMLDDWKSEALYQVPQLLLNMGARLDWDSKQLRKYDPIVRAYLKDHPVWYVTRGAHGGIMRRNEHDKKEADKAAKLRAKEELKATLEAKAAAAASVQPTGQDNSNT